MKNKFKDKLYCGVDEHVINTRSPIFDDEALKVFCHYIKERYLIHIKKDINKEDAPWTDDYILNTYKFTNVRREQDKASKWLIDNISNNSTDSFHDRIYKTILFRIYNRPDTAEILKLDELALEDNWVSIGKERLDSVLKDNPDYRLFTNAYKTGGTKRGLFSLHPESGHYNYAPLYFVNELKEINFAQSLIDCEDQKEVYLKLRDIKGFGRFIAYQIFIDLTYINEFPFSENEFTVAGPGCYYGLQLLTGKDEYDTGFNGMTSEEIVFWMRDNILNEFKRIRCDFDPDKVFSDLPEDERHFNVMSLENLMCEFSKYYAIYTGVRKGRMKYIPNRS